MKKKKKLKKTAGNELIPIAGEANASQATAARMILDWKKFMMSWRKWELNRLAFELRVWERLFVCCDNFKISLGLLLYLYSIADVHLKTHTSHSREYVECYSFKRQLNSAKVPGNWVFETLFPKPSSNWPLFVKSGSIVTNIMPSSDSMIVHASREPEHQITGQSQLSLRCFVSPRPPATSTWPVDIIILPRVEENPPRVAISVHLVNNGTVISPLSSYPANTRGEPPCISLVPGE